MQTMAGGPDGAEWSRASGHPGADRSAQARLPLDTQTRQPDDDVPRSGIHRHLPPGRPACGSMRGARRRADPISEAV